jgi:hypothetical protein
MLRPLLVCTAVLALALAACDPPAPGPDADGVLFEGTGAVEILSLDDEGNGVGLYRGRSNGDVLQPAGGAETAMADGDSAFGFTGAALSFVHTLSPSPVSIQAAAQGGGVLLSAITALETRTSTPDALVADGAATFILAHAARDGFSRVVTDDVGWAIISTDPLIGFGDRARGDGGDYDLVVASIDPDTLVTTDLFAIPATSFALSLQAHRDDDGFVIAGETAEPWVVQGLGPVPGPFVVVRTDLAGAGVWGYQIAAADGGSTVITTTVVGTRAIVSGRTAATIAKPDGSESTTVTPAADESWIVAIDLASGERSAAVLLPQVVQLQSIGGHLIGRRVDPSIVLLDDELAETALLSATGNGSLVATSAGPGSLVVSASAFDGELTLASGRAVQNAALVVPIP